MGARRQRDEAEHWLRRALKLAQEIGNLPQLWKTHLALGHLHAEARRSEQARQAYRAACEVIDQIKARVHTSALQASLNQSPVMQQVYALRTSL